MSTSRRPPRACAVFAFVALAVAANVLTSVYGLMPIGFGLTVTAGTWAAGLVLLARDWVQDTCGRWTVLALIAVGSVLSAALTSPALAVASGIAFAVSELADLAVYTPLRRRSWARAALASNLAGAVVDSLLFLTLAGFGLSWGAVGGQVGVKLAATITVVGAVTAVALLRHRVRPEGA